MHNPPSEQIRKQAAAAVAARAKSAISGGCYVSNCLDRCQTS